MKIPKTTNSDLNRKKSVVVLTSKVSFFGWTFNVISGFDYSNIQILIIENNYSNNNREIDS